MEHKVYIVNLGDDVIMPFWSERVIVLSSCALRSGDRAQRRLPEKRKKGKSLSERENTNKYYDFGTVKCVRLTLVDPG